MPRVQWAGMIDVAVVACVADLLIPPEVLNFIKVGKMSDVGVRHPREISIGSHLSVHSKKRKNCNYLGSTVEGLPCRLGYKRD